MNHLLFQEPHLHHAEKWSCHAFLQGWRARLTLANQLPSGTLYVPKLRIFPMIHEWLFAYSCIAMCPDTYRKKYKRSLFSAGNNWGCPLLQSTQVRVTAKFRWLCSNGGRVGKEVALSCTWGQTSMGSLHKGSQWTFEIVQVNALKKVESQVDHNYLYSESRTKCKRTSNLHLAPSGLMKNRRGWTSKMTRTVIPSCHRQERKRDEKSWTVQKR